MYRVLVNGRNFLIESDGSLRKLGFFVTRYVSAADEQNAESDVIAALRSDVWLRDITKNDESDPPMLFTEEIVPVVGDDLQHGEASGYSWYDE